MTELKSQWLSRPLLALAGLGVLASTCGGGGSTGTAVPAGAGAQSASMVAAPARLVATSRTEPKSFNRLVSPFAAEELFVRLTQATLLRVNHVTGQLEPWLATSWTGSDDGKTWTLKLRPDVTFSDGTAFSSADVQFTFDALFDKRVASELATSLLVGGQPIVARATSADTVILTFAASYGPGLVAARCDSDSAAPQARGGTVGGEVSRRVVHDDAPGGDRRVGTVRTQRVRPRATAALRAQFALLAEGRERRGRCLGSARLKSRSCRTRTPSCCA